MNSSLQCGGTCNHHLEGLLHHGYMLNRPGLTHSKLGPPFRTGVDHTQLALTLNTEPQALVV